ncbi:MAG: type II toxin-antitoxin system VapC family toxin [Solirubrobacterales bacterium]|nr:type II toxin-antitoxin system VapC family toxin [Solirubrobacterales bacterium]
MRLLLDTNVVLGRYSLARPLGPRARELLGGADELVVSVVVFVEVGIKVRVGKLPVPDALENRVRRDGIRILGLTPAHGLAVGSLPLHHRDPFDRLMIVQAEAEGLTILTADQGFSAYDVPVLDALA